MQRGELDNCHRGQCMRYCELMLHGNPGRNRALCVLTNCESMEVYCAHREPGRIQYTRSSPVQLTSGDAQVGCCTRGWPGVQEWRVMVSCSEGHAEGGAAAAVR